MKKVLFTYISLLFSIIVFSQGVINNGAQIVFAGAGQIYISGGASGGYLSQAGGIIQPSAAGIITMEGNWTNNSANTGFGSDNGTVVFNGAAQSINGTNSTTFYNLTLQGSGTKSQNLNTSVGGVITTNGILSLGTRPYNLNSFTLTMTNPAIGGITNSSGYIISETNLAANPSVLKWNMGVTTGAHVYPFGTVGGLQIPFTFNKTTAGASNISVSTRPTAASDNLPWSTPVTHMYSPIIGGNGSIPVVIDRWWDILATSAVSANAIFSYLGTENTLSVPYNTGNLGAQNWNAAWYPPIGSNAAVAAGVGNVSAPGISVLTNSPGATPWVLSSLLAPLPIELVDFSAACSQNNKVILNWSTAAEKNGSHFDVMNSTDGIEFIKIATVNAAGNTNSVKKYSYVVENKNNYGNYFRLKMADSDYSFKNSKTEFVNDNCDLKEEAPTLYFNQQTGIVITSTSKEATAYTLNIIDAAGRLIRTNSLPVNQGYNNIVIDPQLANGIYLVTLICNNGKVISKKIPVL
jgi:hypothetical protein